MIQYVSLVFLLITLNADCLRSRLYGRGLSTGTARMDGCCRYQRQPPDSLDDVIVTAEISTDFLSPPMGKRACPMKLFFVIFCMCHLCSIYFHALFYPPQHGHVPIFWCRCFRAVVDIVQVDTSLDADDMCRHEI